MNKLNKIIGDALVKFRKKEINEEEFKEVLNNAKQSPLLKHGKEWKTNVNSELKIILTVIQPGIKEFGWKHIISTRDEKKHVNSQPQKMILHLHLPDPDYNGCLFQLLDSWLKGDYFIRIKSGFIDTSLHVKGWKISAKSEYFVSLLS